MSLKFESDFRNRIMWQHAVPSDDLNSEFLESWKSSWKQELSKWHSPYKAFLDFSELKNPDSKLISSLINTVDFYLGFHVQKLAIYVHPTQIDTFKAQAPDWSIAAFFDSPEEAKKFIGVRPTREGESSEKQNFRDSISIQNHFEQRTMELSFSNKVSLSDPKQIKAIQSKITNVLMQWHSKWNLIVDLNNVESVDPKLNQPIEDMLKWFKRFFLEQAIGYKAEKSEISLPFKIYRSRHRAAASLETFAERGSDEAHCRSSGDKK